jgi:hypothetical protein
LRYFRRRSIAQNLPGLLGPPARSGPAAADSGEQYFAGGMDTVRGYLTYEAIGDHGSRAG